MIIECPRCECKVDAKVIAEYEAVDEYDDSYRVSLLKCPICKEPLLANQESDWSEGEGEDSLGSLTRLWPHPDINPSWNLPGVVKESLIEARKCYKATAYASCAVMCGRVLEAICTEFHTKDRSVAGGLRELIDRGIIDKKIFEWGEALRKHRNIGAHASHESISKEDAKDLLDFANAICDYVFLLTLKFESFMKRKQKARKPRQRRMKKTSDLGTS